MAALFFFSCLSLNLLLSFALGLREMISRERPGRVHLYYPWGILFVSTLLLWVFFARLAVFRGVGAYLLMFPLSVLLAMALEKLLFRYFPRLGENPGVFAPGAVYNGLSAAALFLTLSFALSFAEAVLLSFALSAGGLLSFFIIKEIQKRSFLEAVPYGLRGRPILLISMGLLSLIFSSAAVLFLKIAVK